MKRPVFVAVGIVTVIFIVLAGIKTLQIRTMIAFGKTFQPPPETIAAAVAHEESWRDSLFAVGSINAEQGIIVTPEVSGTVMEIAFESGANVTKGDLLVKLDTATEDAQLRAAEASADLAKVSAERLRKLRADGTASQAELDQAEATFKQAGANAEMFRATINKKIIRAPFTGQLGIRQINLGEQIPAGKAIVSLQALAPVFADFSLPQQDLEKIAAGLTVRVTSDTFPGKFFDGEVTAINPDLDAATRSIGNRAKLANADKLLRPGMFVRAEVIMPGEAKVLVIPSTSLLSAPYGDSVFVIETKVEDGKTNSTVQQKFIKTGRAQGDFVSVISGLNPGDKIASAGIFKLRNGMSVVENNEMTPKASKTPTPPNS